MNIDLYNGDCLQEMNNIQSNSIDLVLTDPPYGTTECKWDSIIDLDLMWHHLKRVIKDDGVIILMAQTPFDKVLGSSNIDMLKYEWIWEKNHATGHLNAKKCPMKAHENILVFYNKLPTYNPQMTHGHKRKTAFKKKENNSDVYNGNSGTSMYDSTSRYPRSVKFVVSDKHKTNFHPTQKPVELMEYLIKTYTNKSDTVLDFTMGSGTTGVAAKNLDRNFIGIELDEIYFNIANERIDLVNPLNHMFNK